MMPPVVVMGVSGTGKSTVGIALAVALGVPFCEGDDLHPHANVDKMSAGTPLTDEDRWPWLDRVGAWLAAHDGAGVASCSALRRVYRDRLRAAAPDTAFILLDADASTLCARLLARHGHFMPASLLDSQLATLERPAPDERALILDATQPLDATRDAATAWLRSL
jgi:gluconokinase